MTSVLCIGEAMVELSDMDSGDGRVAMGFAGDTLNTAIYLARKGANVSYMTALGQDRLSDQMVAMIEDEGIGTQTVFRDPELLPGIYAVELDGAGERRFRYWRGASAARQMFEGRLNMDMLDGFDVIYLSGITLAILPDPTREALITKCAELKAAGRHIVFDSNYRPVLWESVEHTQKAFDRMWRATSCGLPSVEDEQALWGDDLHDLLERFKGYGLVEFVLKNGAEGPFFWDGSQTMQALLKPALFVVDTTAAGDSFNAGYLAARIQDVEIPNAITAGHELASYVIGHHGAIAPKV